MLKVYSATAARTPAIRRSAGAAIEADLVDHVYANLPMVLAANLINGGIFAVVFAGATPASAVVSWWGLILAVVVVRGWMWGLYRKIERPAARAWSRMAIAGASATGVLWGAAGWFFFIPNSPIHYAALAFVLAGMAAGALVASTAILASYYVYLYLSLLPFVIRLTLAGDPAHLSMAAMAVLFISGLTLIGRRSHDALVHALTLRYENEDLVRTLEQRVALRTAELQQHAGRQESIVEFGQHALAADDIELLCRQAVSLVAHGLEVEYAAVLRPRADGDVLEVGCAFGWQEAAVAAARIPKGVKSPSGLALATGEAVVSEDLVNDSRFQIPLLLGEHDTAASLDVVILGGSGPCGVLHASTRTPRPFSAADVHFTESVANMLAAAIDKKRALDEVQHMAMHDALTGLPNRVLFRDKLAQALARFRRSGETMAVMLLDLDSFKDVNDTMGHLVGDQVLRRAAERLISCVRETDPSARVGGDEFAVILTEMRDPADAALVAAKIIGALSSPFAFDARSAHIGVSIGIAICPADGDAADVLLRNADLALYRAKARGGNAYEFHQSTTLGPAA